MISSLCLYLGLLAVFFVSTWAGLRLVAKWRPVATGQPALAGQLAALEGLRGILALSVFIHHAWCMRNLSLRRIWTDEGDRILGQAAYFAVTLFFFITGFLFWSKLQQEPRPAVWNFYRARIRRLVPAYWASLAFMGLLIGSRQDWLFRDSPAEALWNVTNWMLFTLPGQEHALNVSLVAQIFGGIVWTLRFEWIFYFLIPFCGWFAVRRWRTGLFLVFLLGLHALAMNMVTGVMLPQELTVLLSKITAAFVFCFSGGIVVAMLRPWLSSRFGQINFLGHGFSLLGVGLVVATFFFGPLEYGFAESGWLLVPFLLLTLGNNWFGLLTAKPALFLGKISYSVYLLHSLLLYLLFHLINRSYAVEKIPDGAYWGMIALLGGVVIAVAALWHRLFEAPFMRTKRS